LFVPVRGTAWSSVPLPCELTVCCPAWQVDPSESMVSTPCTELVPTVSCDPPLTDSEVQPFGSSSHRAGVRCSPMGHGRAVAERTAARVDVPRMPPKSDRLLERMITRMRWHWVPSLSRLPPIKFASAISESGTG
jgi:hypothetical protein